MSVKLKPHHPLRLVQALYASGKGRIANQADNDASAIGYTRAMMLGAIADLSARDFIKSETAHNPPNSQIWHDTYNKDDVYHIEDEDFDITLYIKFAGQNLTDLTLTSFKEK